MIKKILNTICVVFFFSISVYGEDYIDLSLEFNNHINDSMFYYNEIEPQFSFNSAFFRAVADISFINDGKYHADISNLPDGTMLGYYSVMNNGFIEFNYNDFSLSVGQKQQSDYIKSDYSLFISGKENPAFIADFIYDGGLFYYETRWIRLNERSALFFTDNSEFTSLERGANFKTYVLKLGDFRLGFQDAAVYLNRSFDLEYFVNPLPQYFIQYTKIGDGRPWQTVSNENNLIGAFLDYSSDDIYFYAQYLMDDFNLKWLLPDTPDNPNKMAYALGGRIQSEFGKFSFDAALAFKYTFEATYTSASSYSLYPYEYTYYPSSTFEIDGESQTINYVDNYLGYKYGENNIAVQIDYENEFCVIEGIPFKYRAGVEYTVSGSKSPSNPWQELIYHQNNGTKLFDEDVLEHMILTNTECTASWNGFSATLGFTIGYVFNELALTEVVTGEAPFFVPQSGVNRWLYDIKLGIGYQITF